MKRSPIPVARLQLRPLDIWENRWFALFAGDFRTGDFNAMTVAWGSLGTMWNLPFAQVVVRPTRHTHGFLERHESFTLNGFPSRYRKALSLIGSTSGRDGDKIAAAGLTPAAATQVAAPCFEEADLVLECRKIYWQDFDPAHFLIPEIEEKYPQKDYHRVYFGQILAVSAAAEQVE